MIGMAVRCPECSRFEACISWTDGAVVEIRDEDSRYKIRHNDRLFPFQKPIRTYRCNHDDGGEQ